MPTPATLESQQSLLTSYAVGEPVSATHGARWALQLAHLLGRQVHRVCSCTVQKLAARTASAKTVKVAYQRSRGARLAVIRVEMQLDDFAVVGGGAFAIALGYLVTVAVTLPSGASWIDQGMLDGVLTCSVPSPFTSGRIVYEGIADVTGCSVTAAADFIVTITGSGAGTHEGLQCVTILESPLSAIKPESGEYGITYTWPDPRNVLSEGDADGPKGFKSIVQLEQSVATELRWMWQLVGYEDSAPTTAGDTWFHTGTTMSEVNWRAGIGAAYLPWYAKSRKLYGTSAGMVVTVRVRYYSANGGKLRLVITPTGGASTNSDITLPVSAAWTTVTQSVTLPATGTLQEFSIEPRLQDNNVAGTTYISQIAMIQTEAL